MNKTIPYKWDDFTMLGLIEINPFVLTVNPKSGIKTFAEFEAKIKKGEEMTYSCCIGVGTLSSYSCCCYVKCDGSRF